MDPPVGRSECAFRSMDGHREQRRTSHPRQPCGSTLRFRLSPVLDSPTLREHPDGAIASQMLDRFFESPEWYSVSIGRDRTEESSDKVEGQMIAKQLVDGDEPNEPADGVHDERRVKM